MALAGTVPVTSELVTGATTAGAGVSAAWPHADVNSTAGKNITAIPRIGGRIGTQGFYVIVHLIDGTYELFRHYYAVPKARDSNGIEVAAVRGVLGSLRGMLNSRVATHIGVATDHVIESFRNDLWPGYKTGEGIEPELLSQFHLMEEALTAFGVKVWPMVEYEADDALAAAAVKAATDPRVTQVRICTPDKDLSQCVSGTRIVQEDRMRRSIRDEAGVIAKFGVGPESVPDYLALVGDSSDGYPGLPGWGAKSAAAVLARFKHINQIPSDYRTWGVNVGRPGALSITLEKDRALAMLFRDLATLRTDIPVFDSVDQLEWHGPTPAFQAIKTRLDSAPVT
jgi:5'-3' exonuclease